MFPKPLPKDMRVCSVITSEKELDIFLTNNSLAKCIDTSVVFEPNQQIMSSRSVKPTQAVLARKRLRLLRSQDINMWIVK